MVVLPSASQSPPPSLHHIVSSTASCCGAEPSSFAGNRGPAGRFTRRRHWRHIVAGAQWRPPGVAVTWGPLGGTQPRHVCGSRQGVVVGDVCVLPFFRMTSMHRRGPWGRQGGGCWAASSRVRFPSHAGVCDVVLSHISSVTHSRIATCSIFSNPRSRVRVSPSLSLMHMVRRLSTRASLGVAYTPLCQKSCTIIALCLPRRPPHCPIISLSGVHTPCSRWPLSASSRTSFGRRMPASQTCLCTASSTSAVQQT